MHRRIAFDLWAKSDCRTERWHALPYHLVDVGAAGEVLWTYLSPKSRAMAVAAFADEQLARRLVCFLAASHDVGKANRYFQGKVPLHRKRLAHLGVNDEAERARHGQGTFALMTRWLERRWGWDRVDAAAVAGAVGGHHGVFPQSDSLDTLGLGQSPFSDVANSLIDALAELWELPEPPPAPRDVGLFVAWLAGFVSVADWLGSNEQLCGWRQTCGDLAEYLREAKARAETLFESIHWDRPVASRPLSISDLVPEGSRANALQQLCETIARQGFSFAIAEAPTAEGKTEGSFRLSEYGRSLGEGVAFLLPTMATANGMYGRFERYLKLALGEDQVTARLLHSMAWMNRVEFNVATDDEAKAAVDVVADWFAGGKRGLLAPYGIGTIDQSLVAVLKARHGFIRLFALTGKTVVIDEVHAYDVYMSDLLDRLLSWLKPLGCRVVLLSATLPRARRRALLETWGYEGAAETADYPCVHWIDEKGLLHAETFDVRRRKPVRYQLFQARAKAGADLILKLVQSSAGVGCLVLNTVREAQEAYEYLVSLAPEGLAIDLFHARFTAEDRAAKEAEVLARYGKDRPAGQTRILVATQVVEQSLDLDFDHMVSALAPIDLLIQRAGRLHRHARSPQGELLPSSRADERPDPTLYVIAPELKEEETPFGREYVYARDVLLRTLDRLEAGFVNADPVDVAQAVDHVYREADRDAVREEWQAQYEELHAKAEANRRRQRDQADLAMIDPPSSVNFITDQPNGFDEYDQALGSQLAARTRLEEMPSLSLIVLPADAPPIDDDYNFETKRNLALKTVKTPLYGNMIEAFQSLPNLPNPARAGALKYAKLLELSPEGHASVGEFDAYYDPKRGLRITRHETHL